MNRYDSLILHGFHPDPCIVRVEEDYYLATSTFEWYPGVLIYHSKNLVNWELAARPLESHGLLDMKGCHSHSGVWAPCLSYNKTEGLFYLTYTDVKWRKGDREFTGHNYVTTAKEIQGPWSDRVYLNSSGFDPSIFHDDDGKKYLLNPRWDHRGAYDHSKYPFLKDIVLQEYDSSAKKLVGKPKRIFTSTDIGLAEGPHIYKKNGYYYLVVAEGGTFYGHAVTMARSKNIQGPYELHPNNPILTSAHNPELRLQKAGHASICDDPYGNYYMVHLCGRPLEPRGACTLGRETAIQNIVYKDGWFQMEEGNEPKDTFETPYEVIQNKPTSKYYTFETSKLDNDFMWLRGENNNYEFIDGKLRIYGAESLQSTYNKSFYARKLQHFYAYIETSLTYSFDNFQQYAGLAIYYDDHNYYLIRVTYDEEKQHHTLNIIQVIKGKLTYWLDPSEEIEVGEKVTLGATIDMHQLSFSYNGKQLDQVFDMKVLSDDYAAGFTGTHVGIICSDFSGQKTHADFRYFKYQVKEAN